MIISSIEKIAEDIGFDIGQSTDEVQAKLLNGFCRALHNSIIEEFKRDTQICYIVDKLDINAKIMLLKITEFIAHEAK